MVSIKGDQAGGFVADGIVWSWFALEAVLDVLRSQWSSRNELLRQRARHVAAAKDAAIECEYKAGNGDSGIE